ncbi:hypothetical protein DUNSADRAFT_1913 [Dunaliella salina]|uniref:Encoded protein n=1 Tax=Dunaliella salina TaxID=3046 RepID=A0ABQ7GWH7_DUNSA|nr:hypothetical protein DUNSADRAFT_1913 [Dunaliella salina]|eukprot:KAF5838968.1 hypothetical protein DUNSADRAFT_1913 [Dunaliella salina]
MLSRNYRWKPTAYFSLNSMFANPEKRLFLRAEDACMFFQCGHTYIHTCTVHFSQFSYYNDSHCTSDVHHGSDQSIARVCKQNFNLKQNSSHGEHGVPRHVGLPCLMP